MIIILYSQSENQNFLNQDFALKVLTKIKPCIKKILIIKFDLQNDPLLVIDAQFNSFHIECVLENIKS